MNFWCLFKHDKVRETQDPYIDYIYCKRCGKVLWARPYDVVP